jgi:hypothetical protein
LVGALGQSGRSMRRADAIVRCALDLGLRSSEIARLSLDDIDWRAGTLVLRHTKGRREDVLPLSASTGEAIAAYVKHERPKTSSGRSSYGTSHHAISRLVPTSFARPFARPTRAGLLYTRSRICCATRWLTGCWREVLAEGSSRRPASPLAEHYAHLRQASTAASWSVALAVAGECVMSALTSPIVCRALPGRAASLWGSSTRSDIS